MHPLSPWLYFRRNLKRTLPVLAIIALAVVGVLVVGILANTQLETPKVTWIQPTRIYATISPRKGTLDPNIGANLRANPDVERVVPVVSAYVRGITLMGSQQYPVPGLPEKEIEWYMDHTGWRLTEGRLPQGSRREIALHTDLMKSKGLAIGDMVGKDIDPDEWLPGKFQIVGVIDGPVQGGITTAAAMRQVTRNPEVLRVFARPGRMEALDKYVRTLASEDVDVSSLSTAMDVWVRETAFVTPMIMSINGITVLVLSLAVGLLNQIYFLQRIPEYGILLAMGYRVSYLIRRTLTEALTLTVVGWFLGLGLAYSLSWGMHEFVFGPQGLTLAQISPSIAATTLPIPVLIALFSLVTVVRRLLSMDPVSIVERRD